MERQYRLLIADADASRRAALARQLTHTHPIVAEAAGLADLPRAMDEAPADLVLLRADEDALGALEYLKTRPEWDYLSVVLIGDARSTPVGVRLLHHGADDFVVEPCDLPLLDAKIAVCLAKEEERYAQHYYRGRAEQLAAQMEYIAAQLGIALSSETDFGKLVTRSVEEAMRLANAEAGALYLRTNGDGLRLETSLSMDGSAPDSGFLAYPITTTPIELPANGAAPDPTDVVAYAAVTCETVTTPDLRAIGSFDFSAAPTLDTAAPVPALTVPLLKDTSGSVMGVLQLFNPRDASGKPGSFDKITPLVEAVAAQTAVAINNHMILKQREMLGKIENDIVIGRRIQGNFMPQVMPVVPGVRIRACFRPAREVAGDFYDVFMMLNNRRVGFFIADVTDKGVGAALFMSLTRSLLRAFAMQTRNLNWADTLFGDEAPTGSRSARSLAPSRLAIQANALKTAVMNTNEYITEHHLDLNMFATLFFGMLDPVTGNLAYINGGHCPPVILNQRGEIKERLEPTGPAVGMFPGAEFELMETQLEQGDLIYLFTDGCTDARNPQGKFFKEERLLQLVAQPVSDPDELVDKVDNTLTNFIGDANQFDDITMLCLMRE